MRYLNNWITQLTADLPPDGATLPVDPAYFGLLADAQYLLTLVNSTNPIEQTAWEIIKVTIADGVAAVERGQEETAAQYWMAGSTIYCGFTAGGMNELFGHVETMTAQIQALLNRVSQLEAGGLPPSPFPGLVDQQNNGLIDDQGNSLNGGL